jgi:hypothetical protein
MISCTALSLRYLFSMITNAKKKYRNSYLAFISETSLEKSLRSRRQCTLEDSRTTHQKTRKQNKNLFESTSSGRICLISVSNLVLPQLHCDVAQSKTQTPNRCPLSSPLAMILPLLLFLSDPSSTPSASVPRLFVREELEGNKSAVRVYLVEFSVETVRTREEGA